MKFELMTLAALAASATAIPLRIITFTGPIPHLPPSEVEVGHPHHHEEGIRIMPFPHPHPHPPCHGQGGPGPSPFADLFTRLGFGPAPIKDRLEIVSAVHKHEHQGGGKGNKVVEAWKAYVEHKIGGPARELVPIMQSGAVRVSPFTELDEARIAEAGHGHHRHGHGHGHHEHGQGGHLKFHSGHHWRHKASTFAVRLHRALLHLSPPEAITLAFVLGAGIGSILHLVFMLLLLSVRRIRAGRGMTKEQRRQDRRERRQARQEGRINLIPGEEKGGEVLPSYKDGEGDRLVEKA